MGNDIGVDDGLAGNKRRPPVSHKPGDSELDKMVPPPPHDSEDTALGESKPMEPKPGDRRKRN